MEGCLIWHGSRVVSFRTKDELWAYLTKAKAVPERTIVRPMVDEALVESVEQALRRGVSVQKIARNSKPDLSHLEPEDLLTKLGLV